MSKQGKHGSITANIWKLAKQTEWKYICWNIQPTKN